MIAPTHHLATVEGRTSTLSHIKHALGNLLPLNRWLMQLDKKSLQTAFIYSGYTEHSYLEMAWQDYSQDSSEFIFRWSNVLVNYYQYLQQGMDRH